MKHPFNDEEMTILFEFAREGLSDADRFDDLAEQMDIADDEMERIQIKLENFLQEEVR